MRAEEDSGPLAWQPPLREAPRLVISPSTALQMVVVRLRAEPGLPAPGMRFPGAPECFAGLPRNYPRNRLWLVGLHRGTHPSGDNGVSFMDVRETPAPPAEDGFDYLAIHITRSSRDEIGRPPVGRSPSAWRWPQQVQDSTLATLGRLLIPALEGRADPNSPFVQHVGCAIHIHLASAYGGVEEDRPVNKGGLAAWQERRAKECMQQNFAASLSISDIARECGLSPSHFTRAFRQSTGLQPHRWLTLHRLETAKARLLEGRMSLAEISLSCGFGDQNNFTRVFSSIVGVSPGHWQRLNR
ncbi:helix-turn-helix domain-containing protein [Ancylobacter sp.]|uniref:helix-turn-helix domain-containing protein n=1 Tax=Ancylobacter sp. TaxID=1872567 RepID=UPI003D131BE6